MPINALGITSGKFRVHFSKQIKMFRLIKTYQISARLESVKKKKVANIKAFKM